MSRRCAENFVHTGIRSPDRPVCSESLHRLSCPGPYIYIYIYIYVRTNVCVCVCVCTKCTEQVTSDLQPFPSIDHRETSTVQNCGKIYCKNMRTVHAASVCGHIIQLNYSNLNSLRHDIHQQAIPTLQSTCRFCLIHLS